jgi:cytochrome c oxidase cbb3-type subunit I/II
MELQTYNYDNKVVKQFGIATVVFGIVGMVVGLLIALQLFLPGLNLGPFLSFGRLRPLHTNAVIFAFAESDSLLGMAAHHRRSSTLASVRIHDQQRVCGT